MEDNWLPPQPRHTKEPLPPLAPRLERVVNPDINRDGFLVLRQEVEGARVEVVSGRVQGDGAAEEDVRERLRVAARGERRLERAAEELANERLAQLSVTEIACRNGCGRLTRDARAARPPPAGRCPTGRRRGP